MKTIVAVFSLALVALFTGCNSTSSGTTTATAPKLTPAQGAEALRDSVSTAAILILRNNPNYLPAVQGVATAIDAFLLDASNDVITQDMIDKFVVSVARKNGVNDADIPLFLNLTRRFTALYLDTYKVDVIHKLDPGVTLWIKAVSDGIGDALSAINSAKQS